MSVLRDVENLNKRELIVEINVLVSKVNKLQNENKILQENKGKMS